MPGWHDDTREAREEGRVRMVGIVEEQHADRARLFMQWQEMEWPLMVDALNRLEVSAVPYTVFVDEAGITRAVRPDKGDLEAFLDRPAPEADAGDATPIDATAPDLQRLRDAAESGAPGDRSRHADALVEWGDARDWETAIRIYDGLADEGRRPGWMHFRAGVAYRKRYDSPAGREGDFARAIGHWDRALSIDPNQYIWRRRIQQYGPRLDKPYPFYDWISRARKEIRERGEEPHPLAVEPSGAEFAHPAGSDDAEAAPRDAGKAKNPDPEGRIDRDGRGFVRIDPVWVPATNREGAGRVHLTLEPNSELEAHWNNEAEPLRVWIEPPEGWRAESRLHAVANPEAAVSGETRRIEFELSRSDDARRKPVDRELQGYALYNVCEDVDGVCLYRRRDFRVRLSDPTGAGE